MKKLILVLSSLSVISVTFALPAFAATIACPFNKNLSCTLQRDILNDVGANGLKYYASTNYDHRMSSEQNVYSKAKVNPYTDSFNLPGQLRLSGNPNAGGNPAWYTGEIMTRRDLQYNPWNSCPTTNQPCANPWSTRDAWPHGYLEVIVKNARCEKSDDGLCQANSQSSLNYNYGLWPSIWMEPWMDSNWPQNGEIDLMEAYGQYTQMQRSDTTIHFNGSDPACQANDCVSHGYHVQYQYTSPNTEFAAFHTWGFEWQPDTTIDPQTGLPDMILTGYFDNQLNWGPLYTRTLPADGRHAMSRGWNDPDGGYYLIVNLAVSGLYTGVVSSHVQEAAMYLQSAKAYTVSGSVAPPATCPVPANIQSMYSADKKQVTLGWMDPTTTNTVQKYQVYNWQKQVMWTAADASKHCFTDSTLPGTAGSFVYYLQTTCANGTSSLQPVTVTVH